MVKSKKKPVCGKEFRIPKNNKLDKKLLTGGVLFGAGWGLAGLCPGPAIVSADSEADRLVGRVAGFGRGGHVGTEVH